MADICVAGEMGSDLDDRQVAIEAWLVSENGWYTTLQSEKCPDVNIGAVFRKDAKLHFTSGEPEPTHEILESIARGLPPMWSFTGTFRGTMRRREVGAQEQPLDGQLGSADMPYEIMISEVAAIRVGDPPFPLRSAPPPPAES
jgi:hypothetical protein